MKFSVLFFAVVFILSQSVKAQNTKTLFFDDLPLQTYSEGIRPVSTKSNYWKNTIKINGVPFSRGFGAQSPAVLSFMLDGNAKKFYAEVGVDDSSNTAIPLTFYVLADQRIMFQSKPMNVGDPAVKIDVDLTGVKQLGLLITDTVGGLGNKRTNGNWANARLMINEGFTPGYIPNNDPQIILTPAPKNTPQINTAKVFGATPGNPVLFKVATTGVRPMSFSASNLPEGLQIASETGIITGSVKQRGNYEVILKAKNKLGEATKNLTIKIGDTIALTPPIGWNGWNSWEAEIDQEKVLASANAMVSKGLADHGWTYINVDDAWMGVRSGPDTALQPNEKFPDIKGMIDQIHAMGLKAGLYSTPYLASYGGYVGASSDYPTGGETHELFKPNRPPYSRIGKYKFEPNDARQMAKWGVDFLKYDWRIDVASTERMSTALKNSGRDIVFSLSNNAPFEKVNDWVRLSNMYRTGPDIKDSWTSLFNTAFILDKWSPYTGPGHWGDADMMILGDVSIGPVLHPTRLTPYEQYSHVSIFSLIASPMLIGCPIERLDAFTLNLLSNDEIIAINQDPLGKAARLVLEKDGFQVWKRELENGDYAVGIFNIAGYGKTPQSYFRWGNEQPKTFALNFNEIGLLGNFKIRDVWRQKDLGVFKGKITTSIPHHGVVMFRLKKSR
ncbi:MAG: NPCBM/NEW2 domain-containing protein [Chitinophagaceae bacterium]|nr:NPCBM/NEW2 domain-containing protein [Chitinophagaceae bacterium]